MDAPPPSTFAPRRTWQGSRPPVTNRCIDKGERGDRRGVGAHHARPERDRKHVRLLDKKSTLIMSESALGADQHGEWPGALGRKRGKWRSLRRSLVGKDQEPGGIPTIKDRGQSIGLSDLRHPKDATLLGR